MMRRTAQDPPVPFRGPDSPGGCVGRLPSPPWPPGQRGAVRWRLAFAGALLAITATVPLLAGPAAASRRGGATDPGAPGSGPGEVLVINVSGLIDPVVATFIGS